MARKNRTADLISAALRHVRDAEALLQSSTDQSWHLAAFGPECARKACLEQGWFDRVLGHDLAEISDTVLEIALSLDTQAGRYEVRNVAQRYPKLMDWRVECRYARTGTRDAVQAKELVDQAASLTYTLAAELWMDGRIHWIR